MNPFSVPGDEKFGGYCCNSSYSHVAMKSTLLSGLQLQDFRADDDVMQLPDFYALSPSPSLFLSCLSLTMNDGISGLLFPFVSFLLPTAVPLAAPFASPPLYQSLFCWRCCVSPLDALRAARQMVTLRKELPSIFLPLRGDRTFRLHAIVFVASRIAGSKRKSSTSMKSAPGCYVSMSSHEA